MVRVVMVGFGVKDCVDSLRRLLGRILFLFVGNIEWVFI